MNIQINIEYNDYCTKHFTMKCGNPHFLGYLSGVGKEQFYPYNIVN